MPFDGDPAGLEKADQIAGDRAAAQVSAAIGVVDLRQRSR